MGRTCRKSDRLVRFSNIMLMTSERLLYADHVRYVGSRAISGPSVECVWRIDQVFFHARCTSI
jgi:hypothetical protein